MKDMLKQLQSNPPPAQVKVVEEICVTCRGYRPQGVANQMRPPGIAQPNVQNNQNRLGQPQGFNRTNFNQEQPYQATAQSNQNFHLNELEKIKRMNDVSLKAMQNQIDMVKNELRNEMKTFIHTSLSNQTNEIKNMMTSLLQMNTASTSGSGTLPGNTIANPKGELKAITTRSGLVTDGPTVSNPPKSVNPEEDESDFVVVNYESDHRVPLILGTPFLRTARALIDVHGEEMILRDEDERLTLNMKHDTASYSNHPHRDLVNLINIFNIPNIDSFNDIHPYFDDDPLSGSTTFSANSLLEEFTDELALITYPPDYDDNRTCDIKSDLREIEFLLYQGKDYDLKDSIDQSDLANRDDLFVDPTPEMFTDEQPPDYSFPPRLDVYPDDLLEIESDTNNFDDDSFDSKGEKIKESELLIDQLDLPYDIHSEAYWALKHVNFNLKTAGDHRKLQLNELSELRDQAYENSVIYKERTKKLHNSKIKNRIFNVGDQVFLYNSRLKIFSGKLKTRWSGPFTITCVFPYGTIKLSQPNGPNFKVNGHRVKHYFGGDIPSNVNPDLYTLPKDN
nr:reverse transcriptase domain-containing protein [Tanacetum cinerariifolium]